MLRELPLSRTNPNQDYTTFESRTSPLSRNYNIYDFFSLILNLNFIVSTSSQNCYTLTGIIWLMGRKMSNQIINHISILISMPRGGGAMRSSLILISTYFNLFKASCFLNYSSLTEWVTGISGLTSWNLPSGFLFFFLAVPQNSMQDDIVINIITN